MKNHSLPKNGRQTSGGFTLIEMIGVLAVIAILAGLILPKVYNAINDSRITGLVASYQGMEVAAVDHYSKYLSYNSLFGTNYVSLPITNYDATFLISEGLLDHAFIPKCGTNSIVQCVLSSACNNGAGYNFSGSSTTNNATTALLQYVVEAVLTGVSASDANAVSLAVDGPALTPAGYTSTTVDTSGKITYNPALNGGTMNMFIDGH